ncbi:hypothetical protein N7462_008659 [Penicillium macrosclerotiorum]|uniref:uncharacterized protein n=1 Tax=Penicillium macrosclerotiorum TaxID=303699 RepID=UPI002548CCEE|nr:uncharacterized protein N7462_008659 [Penicillium macrosclerotiorum]KAJ5675762.1 hypothetical protein N7462_008659 [Penicillium macrosclerotiorum]
MSRAPAKEHTTPAPSDPSHLPPEEGIRGWLCLLGSFLCMFCSFGFLNSMGVFQKTYEETILKGYSPSSISWISAVQLCLVLALGPIYGRIFDTYGASPILYPCSVCCVLSLCMTSLAHEYYQILLAQGLLFGIGSGGLFLAGSLSVGQWFVRRRGLAMGITSTGSSLGGVIFPIFMDRMIQLVGFANAARYAALLVGILLVIACLLTKARLPRKKWDRDVKWFDAKLFRQNEFAFYTVGVWFTLWTMWAPYNYISTMAVKQRFPSSLTLYLVSMINYCATSIPGRTLPPFLADKFGHFNTFTASSFASGIAILTLWLPFNYHVSPSGLIVFSLIYGFVSGAIVALFMPCVAKLGKLETLGQRLGTFQFVISSRALFVTYNRTITQDYRFLQVYRFY